MSVLKCSMLLFTHYGVHYFSSSFDVVYTWNNGDILCCIESVLCRSVNGCRHSVDMLWSTCLLFSEGRRSAKAI